MTEIRNNQRPRPAGFTLVEMLVVIFIISILVTLIVGVSRLVYLQMSKRQTQSWQAVIVSAIETYYKTKHVYPREILPTDTDYVVQPTLGPPATRFNTRPANPNGNTPLYVYDAIWRNMNLYAQLDAVPQSRDIVRSITSEAISVTTENLDGDPAHTITVTAFIDPWHIFMDYHLTGGRPVIVSGGPDKKLGGDSWNGSGTRYWYDAPTKDNIRSDSQ